MRNKGIYLLVGTISILVVVLVCIQLAWLRNADKKTKEASGLRIQKALSDIEQQLEASIDCVRFFTKYHLKEGEGFYISRQKWNGSHFAGDVDTVNMFYDYAEYRNKGDNKEIPYKYNYFETSYPADIEMLVNIHFLLNDSMSSINDDSRTFSKDNFKDIIASDKPIDELLDMEMVDSSIRQHFRNAFIVEGFGYGFVSKKDNRIVYANNVQDSSSLLSSEYYADVFTDNKFINDYRLSVVLDKQPVWGSISYLLLLSVVIILLLTFAFYKFIRLYLRQNKLSEMKTDFINNLTHEFNTPMANISLALETIEDSVTEVDPKLKHILDIISNESQRLNLNIERALNVAVLEKGTMVLKKDIVDLEELLVVVEPMYTLQCEQLGGTFRMKVKGDCRITGDETHLMNCICNLLDNAIKYKQGPPDIQISIEEQDTNVCMVVADNGIGMNAETQKHIFDKFYRAHEGDIHNTKGFGLGLNYVKGIVEATGGKIEVWSKPGVGTKFTILFPKKRKYDG